MARAKTFTRGWSIRCSQVVVDWQGRQHQWSGIGADKEAVEKIYQRGLSRTIERSATIARYSTSTWGGAGL
jgi:hypothetical protein